MREPPQDPLGAAAESLKWQLITLALMIATLYLLRETVLEARGELEQARRDRAHLENELEKRDTEMDGALETLHEKDEALQALRKAQNGGD